MRAEILKAVAQPPKVLWAPMVPAIINLGIQFPMMFIGIGVADANPLFFIVLIITAHIALVFAGLKEPHYPPCFRLTDKPVSLPQICTRSEGVNSSHE